MQEKVRIGVLGTGWGRKAHLPGYRHTPGAEVVAVFSVPLAEAQDTARQFDIPHVYDDWRKMLAEVELDLVSVVLPHWLHYPVTMAALEAGCHVLCEKVMALNLDEAQEMLAEAEARKVQHMVGHQLRFNPSYRRIKELIQDGFVGSVHHVQINGTNNFRSISPWTWRNDLEAGGGNLLTGACHFVDMILWLLGDVESVSAQIATWIEERPDSDTGESRVATSDDQYSITMQMVNGTQVHLFSSSAARHPIGLRLEIIGSEGTLVRDTSERLWGARAGDELEDLTVPDPNAGLEGVADHIWGISFVDEARELVASIREGRRLQEGATFVDGVRTQAVLDAARRSWHERRWIELNTV